MAIIFHITQKPSLDSAQIRGHYTAPSLETEKFIHCSQHYQVLDTASNYFKGQKNLVLLGIITEKLKSPVVYEGPTWNPFPHIYGPINMEAIVNVAPFVEESSGFRFPPVSLQLFLDHPDQQAQGPLYDRALFYDLMTSSQADIEFYQSLVHQNSGPVLELACGTGRIALALAATGHKVTGLDINKSMLNLAKKKATDQNLKIDLVQGDLRFFELEKKFNLIYCGYNSLQHLHTEKEFSSFLQCVRRHLNAKGQLAFDVFHPSIAMLSRATDKAYPVAEFIDPSDSEKIVVQEYPSYDPARQISTFRFEYLKKGQILFEDQFSLRNYFPLELDLILRNNGARTVEKYGDFKKGRFTSSSLKQIYICQF